MKRKHFHCPHTYGKPALPRVLVMHQYCCECGQEWHDLDEYKKDIKRLEKYLKESAL